MKPQPEQLADLSTRAKRAEDHIAAAQAEARPKVQARRAAATARSLWANLSQRGKLGAPGVPDL